MGARLIKTGSIIKKKKNNNNNRGEREGRKLADDLIRIKTTQTSHDAARVKHKTGELVARKHGELPGSVEQQCWNMLPCVPREEADRLPGECCRLTSIVDTVVQYVAVIWVSGACPRDALSERFHRALAHWHFSCSANVVIRLGVEKKSNELITQK